MPYMRTLVDIPEADLKALADLVARTGKSRAALIREAIAGYVRQQQESSFEDAFGLWGTEGEDGLAYQRRVRAEW